MTLDEMDAKLVEEKAERDAKIAKWNATRNLHVGIENPNSSLSKSFYCINNHHADCVWPECKCVCHDSSDWGGGGYAC